MENDKKFHTNRILAVMIQKKEDVTYDHLIEKSKLEGISIRRAIGKLKRIGVVKIRKERTNKFPYSKAYYSLNPKSMNYVMRRLKGAELI